MFHFCSNSATPRFSRSSSISRTKETETSLGAIPSPSRQTFLCVTVDRMKTSRGHQCLPSWSGGMDAILRPRRSDPRGVPWLPSAPIVTLEGGPTQGARSKRRPSARPRTSRTASGGERGGKRRAQGGGAILHQESAPTCEYQANQPCPYLHRCPMRVQWDRVGGLSPW